MAKVLVVADSESVRDWMLGILSRHGIETFTTDDPRQVYAIVENKEPDVVVTNSQIGSMGMMAVTREIKSEVGMGNIPETAVCVLLDRRADVFLARRAGVDAWLVNPVHPSALRWTVDRLIEDGDSWSEEALEAELAGFDVAPAEADDELADAGVAEVGDDSSQDDANAADPDVDAEEESEDA